MKWMWMLAAAVGINASLWAAATAETDAGEVAVANQAEINAAPAKAAAKSGVPDPMSQIDALRVMLVINKAALKAGLSYEQVRADLEKRWKVLRLPIAWMAEEPERQANLPVLIAEIDASIDESWFRPDTFLVTLHFKDAVQLKRNPSISTKAVLWSVFEHGYDNRIVPALRKSVMRLADSFSLAYAQANPGRVDAADVRALPEPSAKESIPFSE